jgi:hypothetical protein
MSRGNRTAGGAVFDFGVAHPLRHAKGGAFELSFFLYNAPGSLTSLQEGANLITTAFYTPRLQPCRISVRNTGTAPTSCADTTTGNVMDLTYGFNYGASDNGNVQSIANNITAGRSQTYTYDELNRVSTAKTAATSGTYSWGLQFGYDPWANLLSTSCRSPKCKTVLISRGEQFFTGLEEVKMRVGYEKRLIFREARQGTSCVKSNSIKFLRRRGRSGDADRRVLLARSRGHDASSGFCLPAFLCSTRDACGRRDSNGRIR